MTFLVNEQNVSVMYIDISAISLYLDLNIIQQDASNQLKTSLSQIWVICELLPFVSVGQDSNTILTSKFNQDIGDNLK